MSIKALKGQVRKLRAAAGLDRCSCKAEPERAVIVYPGDGRPEIDACRLCRRPLGFYVEVVYTDPGPPDWCKDVQQDGPDGGELAQRWREYMAARCEDQAPKQ